MSNRHIISRLHQLADEVETGSVSLSELCNSLLGHTDAAEGIPYEMVKEAQSVWAQLSDAIDSGDEQDIDLTALVNWIRNWAARVPDGT